MGRTATTFVGGAGKWRNSYASHFIGKSVVILPDNDAPGRAHAQAVAQGLRDVAVSVKVIELPGLPETGDVSDMVEGFEDPAAAGEELSRLAERAELWQLPQARHEAPAALQLEIENLSDVGNARRMVREHGRDLRYVGPWGWLVWDGGRWARDETGEVVRRAKGTVGAIYAQASLVHAERHEKAARHALNSEAAGRIRAMIEMAQSEASVVASPVDFDSEPWLLNVANGTLDLRTGKLQEHRRQDLITKRSPVEYDAHSAAPVFLQFLDRIMEGNERVLGFLRRLIGYSMVGTTREQVLAVLWGNGSNGKTTFLEAVKKVFGDYAQHTPASTFMVQRGDRIPNDVARLQGARLVVASESEEQRQLSESLLKNLTGGDSVSARFLHREYFEFRPEFTPFLATNHRPIIQGVDHAIWRRLKLVPFTVTIPDEEQDKELPAKLEEEFCQGFYPGRFWGALSGSMTA